MRVVCGLLAAAMVAPAAGAAEDPNSRTYHVSSDQVWVAVTRVAYGMPQWIVTAASEESGLMTVRKTQHGMILPKPGVRVVVQRTGLAATRVTLTRLFGGPLDFLSWWADGGEFRQFFKDLDELLPPTELSATSAP